MFDFAQIRRGIGDRESRQQKQTVTDVMHFESRTNICGVMTDANFKHVDCIWSEQSMVQSWALETRIYQSHICVFLPALS